MNLVLIALIAEREKENLHDESSKFINTVLLGDNSVFPASDASSIHIKETPKFEDNVMLNLFSNFSVNESRKESKRRRTSKSKKKGK